MATTSELDLARKYGPYTGLRVLETGAAHGMGKDLRKISEGSTYVATDMQENKKVDIVHNLEDPIIGWEYFDVIYCFSLLEHCEKPWKVAKNLQYVLKPDGLLLLSVPFQWRVHGYPNDYWRFTPNGVKSLFPLIEWEYEATDPPKVSLTSHTNGHVMLLMAGRAK